MSTLQKIASGCSWLRSVPTVHCHSWQPVPLACLPGKFYKKWFCLCVDTIYGIPFSYIPRKAMINIPTKMWIKNLTYGNIAAMKAFENSKEKTQCIHNISIHFYVFPVLYSTIIWKRYLNILYNTYFWNKVNNVKLRLYCHHTFL